jgi:hypothetical protein
MTSSSIAAMVAIAMTCMMASAVIIFISIPGSRGDGGADSDPA